MTNKIRVSYSALGITFLSILIACCLSLPLAKSTVSAATKTTLKVKSKTLYINGTYTIPLKNKVKKKTYFYVSNKTKIAKVNAKGKITARGKGTAKIKVRYKIKKKMKTVGTFKVVVRKSAMKSNVRSITTTVGATYLPSSYLTDPNNAASYSISSTNTSVATGDSKGKITVKKAGTTTLTIVEVYNGSKRTLGKISIRATGASLKSNTLKMAYDTTYNVNDYLDDKISSASYSYSTTNTSLIQVAGSTLIAGSSPGYNTTCIIKVYETRNQKTRLVGNLTISLTQDAFILPENRTLSVGLGSKLSISNYCIKVKNLDSSATYQIVADNTSIISSTQIALRYGTTTVKILEKKAGSSTTTTLSETVKVTVTAANIKTELRNNGLNLILGVDAYQDYPVNYRNHTVNYYYSSSRGDICQAGTGGNGTDEDYLVLNPKNAGTTTITVYEISASGTSRRTVGTFLVTVAKDNLEIENVDSLMVEDIIESCTLYHKGKNFSAVLNSGSRSCEFTTEDGTGILDYGMDYSQLTPGNFSVITKRSRFTLDHIEMEENDPSTWIVYIDLHNATAEHETDIIPITLSLQEAPMDVSSILSSIQIKLGSSRGTINSETTFPNYDYLFQFDDQNTDFEIAFTAKQYIDAGATEYDNTVLNPIYLSELTNVFCTPMQNVWSSANPTANTAVSLLSVATSTDNQHWTFTVTFENGATQDFTVTLGLTE